MLTLKGLPMEPNKTIALISVYMPSTLDFLTEQEATIQLATKLHQQLHEAAKKHDIVIMAGDFQETLTEQDRSHHSRITTRKKLMTEMVTSFTDVYRELHPE